MKKYRKWRDILIEELTADWAAALDYIQFALEEYQIDGDTSVFLLAFRTFVASRGGIEKVAQCTGIDPETLLEILSSEEAPRVDMLGVILNATGCRLSIEPLETERPCTETQSHRLCQASAETFNCHGCPVPR